MSRTSSRCSKAAALTGLVALVITTLSLASTPSAGAAPADRPVAPGKAASAGNIWIPSKASVQSSYAGHPARVTPSRYRAYTLNSRAMLTELAKAPSEKSGNTLTVSLPAPNGEFVAFRVAQTRMMQSELASKHPDIKTYAGRAAGDKSVNVYMDFTPAGLHASVHGADPRATWLIDPAYNGSQHLYLSYLAAKVPTPQKGLIEPRLGKADRDAVAEGVRHSGPSLGEAPGALVSRRTYRLALLTDPSYATYFAPGANDATSNTLVLAEKTTLINRVNQIYNNDLAVRMILVNGTDLLNFNTDPESFNANGPCGSAPCFTPTQISDGCTSALLSRNKLVIGQLIGAGNFDIGHVMLGINGGGLASLGVVGGANKAQGCTGLPTPEGDLMAIDYVSHEMGHQFSGNHTFNGTQVNCSGGNRNAGTSVEPGSGTSVMAYAGICGSDDLQPHSDPYFSQRSQTEITAYLSSSLGNSNEVQSVALTGLDGTESFTLTFPALGTTAPIVRGSNYTAAGVKTAVEAVTGGTVTVAGYFGAAFDDAGFQLTYGGGLAGTNVANPTISPVAGFTGFVNDIVKGGAATNQGFAVEPLDNHAPLVTAPADKSIPIRTPFTLTGVGSDVDGDTLSYLWEQNDRGGATGTGLASNTKLDGPLFRVFGTFANVTPAGTLQIGSPGENLAGTSPSRTFPDLDQILAGTTNAATGNCPTPIAAGGVLDCYSEFLPNATYFGDAGAGNTEPSLNFRLTGRDGDAFRGGYQFDDTKLTIDKLAGPLLVTSQATAAGVGGASPGTVAWAVNSTDKATLAPFVNILMSDDGGQTFDVPLVLNTPNDGSQDVSWPNVATSQARIKIEAVGNYFFDVNDANFTITPTATQPLTVTGPANTATSAQYSDAISPSVSFSASSTTAASGAAITATPAGLPTGLSLVKTASSPGGGPATATFTVQGTALAAPGSYPVTVTVNDGANPAQTTNFTVTVTAESATVGYTGPASAPAGSVALSAQVTEVADSAAGDLSTATVTFKNGATTLCTSPASAAGVAGCSGSLPTVGAQTISMVVGGNYTGTGDGTVTITEAPVDTTAPETTIIAGPTAGQILLTDAARFDYASSEPANATFACAVDGTPLACLGTTVHLTSLSQQTHTFAVAATDPAGNTDATAASRSFTVPVNDRQLTRVGKGWIRHRSSGAYLGTYSSAKKKGATLRRTVSGATSLSLVVGKGSGFGKINVFLNGVKLKTISLNAPGTRVKQLVKIADFGSARSGPVKIVSTSNREVRVEGLAVVSAP